MEMIQPDERTRAFISLGEWLIEFLHGRNPEGGEMLSEAIQKAAQHNPWFTTGTIQSALNSLATMLNPADLESWIQPYLRYMSAGTHEKTVGVVMAGNIPLVGFHDYLCTLISGHRILVKYSSDDPYLLPLIHGILGRIEPRLKDMATFTDGKLRNFDAVIATGSNNTARYFEYYFRNHPSIIRKNRSSLAVLSGSESDEELTGLADDIMRYFGLGCRNVSHLMIPEHFSFDKLEKALSNFNFCLDHHKYRNNLDYYHAVFLLNKADFRLAGPCIIAAGESLHSPVSVLYYHCYSDAEEVSAYVDLNHDQIQTIVSTGTWPFATVKPGSAQTPRVWDYADGIDTLHFLLQ